MQAINFRSPVTWVVIIGGGIAVFFLYRHFAGSGSSSAASANASGATPYPPTNTFLIEEPPETEEQEPSSTTKSKQGLPIRRPKTIPYSQLVADAKKARVSINHEWELLLSEGYTVIDVPKGIKPPAPDAGTTGSDYDHDNGYLGPPVSMPTGGGVDHYIHTPTWPYGGQMIRPRLG